MIPEIDVATLRGELDGPNPPVVIDVREADELAVSRLGDEVMHVPLGELPCASVKLPRDDAYVVVCRVGGRSAQAVAFLLDQGFTNVRNVKGGMVEYVRAVDQSLAHP